MLKHPGGVRILRYGGVVVTCSLTKENVEDVHFLPSKDKSLRYKELILVILI